MHSIKVLFVCLGNICRSPIAHAVFEYQINKLGIDQYFKVDSAGTSGFHIGSPPDPRSIMVLEQNNVKISHKARQINKQDITCSDYILVMDHLNYEDVLNLAEDKKDATKRVFLLRSFEQNQKSSFDIPDPYYGMENNFAEVFTICEKSIIGFIEFLQAQQLIPNNHVNQANIG